MTAPSVFGRRLKSRSVEISFLSLRSLDHADNPFRPRLQLFLEEEREKELEQLYDANLADSINRTAEHEGTDEAEASAVTKQTMETLMSGEKIMEALDIADAERQDWLDYEDAKTRLSPELAAALPTPDRNALLVAQGDISPEKNVLNVIQKIPNASLQDALIVLPFRYVSSMMQCLSFWAKKVRIRSPPRHSYLSLFAQRTDGLAVLRISLSQEWNTTLLSRILLFLLKTHHAQIVSTNLMRPTIISLRTYLRAALRRERETVGYNLAGLRFIQRQIESERTAEFWEAEGMDEEKVRARLDEQKNKTKRKRVVV